MRLRELAGALVVIAVLATAGFFAGKALLGDGGSTPAGRLGTTALDGVDLSRLAYDGITVSAPPAGYGPQISGDDAKLVVAANYPGVTARQVLLAHIKFERGGNLDTQAWIVNLDPTDPDVAGFGKGSGLITFALAFVDANSGKFLYVMGEQQPPPGGWRSLLPPVQTGVGAVTPAPAQ